MVEESFAFLEDNRVSVKPEHDEFSEVGTLCRGMSPLFITILIRKYPKYRRYSKISIISSLRHLSKLYSPTLYLLVLLCLPSPVRGGVHAEEQDEDRPAAPVPPGRQRRGGGGRGGRIGGGGRQRRLGVAGTPRAAAADAQHRVPLQGAQDA